MAAVWPFGTAQIIRIVSYPIKNKSRFCLFCMWSVKRLYHANLPKTDYTDKGRGHDRRVVVAQAAQTLLDFEFIRECMKINKIRPKFHFWTKIEIKGLTLCLCFVIYCLFAARAIWKPFYRRLRFWVVLTLRKIERLGTLKPTVPELEAPSESHEDGPNSPKLESQTLSQPLAKRLILTFFHQGFLSRDTSYRALACSWTWRN